MSLLARACEFATEPRCRCDCRGTLHGRGWEPDDPRIRAGDGHWTGHQLLLFIELAVRREPGQWEQLAFPFMEA